MIASHILLATAPKRPDLTRSDALLVPALEKRGMVVRAVSWDAIPPGGEASSLICLRATWDYHLRPEAFRTWVSSFSSTPSRLWNPPETVLWNMDKYYLEDLAAQGIAIPPTRWLEPRQDLTFSDLFRDTGWEAIVLKPRVSATANQTHLLTRGDDAPQVDWTPFDYSGAMIQSFVPEVMAGGELSLIFLAGSFSHAVRKIPAPGDFRVQPNFGGTTFPESVSSTLRRFGDTVLAAISCDWVYARVDAVETAQGPLLMELELIEPELFLDMAPRAPETLAEALVNRSSHLPLSQGISPA